MDKLIALIQKFQASDASESEKKELLDALENNDQELKTWLETNYNSDLTNKIQVITEKRSSEIFNQIQQLKNIQATIVNKKSANLIPITKSWVMQLAAASIIGIMAICGYFYLSNKQQINNSPLVSESKMLMQKHINNTKKTITVVLQDSSTIIIEPQSAIAYYSPFIEKRDIRLIGKATFKVAKNAAKPFTVYANGISTTALGTVFSIDAFKNKVAVQLFEGKVVVKAAGIKTKLNDIYLNPGEQCFVNNQSGTYAVSKFNLNYANTNKEAATIKTSKINRYNGNEVSALEFNKAQLKDVFSKIGNKYNTIIKFENANLGIATFTGSFLKTDSLKKVLTIICNTNDLLFKEENGIIIIYR